MDFSETLAAIDALHAEAQRIVAQLDEIIAVEPSHERRGVESRLRQLIVDLLVHGIGEVNRPARAA
jgi:hypothetical protein